MLEIKFSKSADKDFEFWCDSDRKTAQKIISLLDEMSVTPYTGKGKPEALKHEYSGYWSRRINSKDRIVYRVDEQVGVLYIVSMRKHYS
ncbi:MAG: Txe/YoeB family addiction module toxin [Akkermansiaceae bacterium]|nr:Txe/YoeB family addiction module toxin [Akkermansiaceae bacterium]